MTGDELNEHIDPFLDNELGLAEAQKIQQHLEQCPTCESLYASRLVVRQALQKPEMRFLPPADLSDPIHGELLKQIRPPARRTWWLPALQFPSWGWPSLAVAAPVLLLWFCSLVFLTAKRSAN